MTILLVSPWYLDHGASRPDDTAFPARARSSGIGRICQGGFYILIRVSGQQQRRPCDGLSAALRRVNALRRAIERSRGESVEVAEAIVDDLFGASERLATYGSLAPGKENHDVVASIPGTWSDGLVRGELHAIGWGADAGYPGMKWKTDGSSIPVKLLESAKLVDHWRRLDTFEGSGYCRILVPVETASGVVVANIYEVRGRIDP